MSDDPLAVDSHQGSQLQNGSDISERHVRALMSQHRHDTSGAWTKVAHSAQKGEFGASGVMMWRACLGSPSEAPFITRTCASRNTP